MPPWTTTDRPRSELPGDRFAVAERASVARYPRPLVVVQTGRVRNAALCARSSRIAAAAAMSSSVSAARNLSARRPGHIGAADFRRHRVFELVAVPVGCDGTARNVVDHEWCHTFASSMPVAGQAASGSMIVKAVTR